MLYVVAANIALMRGDDGRPFCAATQRHGVAVHAAQGSGAQLTRSSLRVRLRHRRRRRRVRPGGDADVGGEQGHGGGGGEDDIFVQRGGGGVCSLHTRLFAQPQGFTELT